MRRKQTRTEPVVSDPPAELLRPSVVTWGGDVERVEEARRVWLANHRRVTDIKAVRAWQVQPVRWAEDSDGAA